MSISPTTQYPSSRCRGLCSVCMDKKTSLAQPSLRRNRLTRTPQARPELTRVAIDAGATQDLTSSDSDWFKLTLESTSRTSLAQPSLRRNRLTRTPKARPELTRHTDRRQHRPRLNIRHHVVEVCVVCAWIRRRVLHSLAFGGIV